MNPSNVPLFLCQMLSLFQSEEDIKSENDEADDMPEVQDTVQFIPGSKLLWRINSRPPNSSQVTVSICPCFALAGDLSRRTWGMVQGPLLSVIPWHRSRLWQFLLHWNYTPASCALVLCWEQPCCAWAGTGNVCSEGIWGLSLTCLGDLCTESGWNMDTPSLLLALLFQYKLPQGAVTGQQDINFHSFSKTFWSFRCGWFWFFF